MSNIYYWQQNVGILKTDECFNVGCKLAGIKYHEKLYNLITNRMWENVEP